MTAKAHTTIDVSALELTPAEVAQRRVLRRGIEIYGAALVCLFIGAFFVRAAGVVLVALTMAMPLLAKYAFGKFKSQEPRLRQFAADNGLSYDRPQEYGSNGVIFQTGNDDHKTGAMFQGELEGYPYRLYWHHFSVGHGRNRFSYDFAVVEIDLPREVPQIFIGRPRKNFLEQETIDLFRRRDMWQLEGDFSEYFNVYAVKKYAPEVLTLLNPAFMAALMDHGADYEIELVDKKAYIYYEDQADITTKTIMKVYTTAEFLILQLQKQLDTFRFEPGERVSDELAYSALKRFHLF